MFYTRLFTAAGLCGAIARRHKRVNEGVSTADALTAVTDHAAHDWLAKAVVGTLATHGPFAHRLFIARPMVVNVISTAFFSTNAAIALCAAAPLYAWFGAVRTVRTRTPGRCAIRARIPEHGRSAFGGLAILSIAKAGNGCLKNSGSGTRSRCAHRAPPRRFFIGRRYAEIRAPVSLLELVKVKRCGGTRKKTEEVYHL